MFFSGSSNKIKFRIFPNLSKCSINILIPFKYGVTCELCGRVQNKCKKAKFQVKKNFVINEEVNDSFH